MSNNNNQEKIKGKDLINVGIYAAIYCVVMTVVSFLGFIPIMLPMLAVICPIIGGIPMMLFYTKVKKFGMITVMTIIIGLYLWITGMGYWPFIFGIVCGLIADLIAKSGNYSDFKKIALSHGALNVTIFGCFLPLYLNIDAYFATRSSYGTEYVDALKNIFQPWTMPVLLVAAFVCGIIGAILGKALMKKHFEKAGIV